MSKHTLKKILLTSLLIPVTFFLIMIVLSLQADDTSFAFGKEETKANTETEYLETETTVEESTQIINSYISYVDEIELDYVPQPEKHSREEAVLKIKELARWYPAFHFVAENEASYPTELLLSGANNPEMADFLYGYLSSDGTVTEGFTEEETPEEHPLFLQYDPRWGYAPYGSGETIGSSGCGPTSLSMVIYYLTGERSCTPDSIAKYSLENRYYVKGSGTAWSLITNYPKLFDLSSRYININETRMKSELDKGHYLICSVRPGNFTSSGHFIVIYGYDENGFKINDPKSVYRSRLSWTFEQIKYDIKAIWSIGK